MMTKNRWGESPPYVLALDMVNVIIHEDPSPSMAKQGLSGRGTRPMMDYWESREWLRVSETRPDNDCWH